MLGTMRGGVVELSVLVAGDGPAAAEVARLVAETASLVGVVSAEPGGTGPLAGLGARWGVPVARPGRTAEVLLADTSPDLLLTVDHPVALLDLAAGARAAVNLHPGFLPSFRGPDAIARAIAAGEDRLGVAAHLVDDGVWTGDLLEVVGYRLDELDDRADAEARAGVRMLLLAERVLHRAAAGPLVGRAQPAVDLWFPERPLGRRGRIDWSRPAEEIHHLVRAMTRPGPGAHTTLGPDRVPVWRTAVADEPWVDGVPGEVVEASPDHAVVVTGDGCIALLDLDRRPTIDLRVGLVLR